MISNRMDQAKKCFSRLKNSLGAAIRIILLLPLMSCQQASGDVTLSRLFNGEKITDEGIPAVYFVSIDNQDIGLTFEMCNNYSDSVDISRTNLFGYDYGLATVPFNNGNMKGVVFRDGAISDGESFDIFFLDINHLVLKCNGATDYFVSTTYLNKLADESETVKYIRHRGQGRIQDSDVDYPLEITIFDYPIINGETVKLARVDFGYYKVNDDGTIDIPEYYPSDSDGESVPGKISFESKEGEDMRISYYLFGGEKRWNSFSKVSTR